MPTADSATHVTTAAPMTAATPMPSGHGARRQHGSECDGGEADHRLACNGLLHDALLNEARGNLPAFMISAFRNSLFGAPHFARRTLPTYLASNPATGCLNLVATISELRYSTIPPKTCRGARPI
jgi:hypothetical protein